MLFNFQWISHKFSGFGRGHTEMFELHESLDIALYFTLYHSQQSFLTEDMSLNKVSPG